VASCLQVLQCLSESGGCDTVHRRDVHNKLVDRADHYWCSRHSLSLRPLQETRLVTADIISKVYLWPVAGKARSTRFTRN